MRLASPGEVNYPKSFVANVIGYGGEPGKRWLRDLPDLIAAVRRRWRLDNLQALPGLSFNYLAKARRQGESCVVKLIWEADALAGETAWLRDQRGRGAVAVRAVADDLGAYLMGAGGGVSEGRPDAVNHAAESLANLPRPAARRSGSGTEPAQRRPVLEARSPRREGKAARPGSINALTAWPRLVERLGSRRPACRCREGG